MSILPSQDSPSGTVDFLILGAGWTSTFLIPLLKEQKITYAATTRSGRENTLPFDYTDEDPDKNPDDIEPFKILPYAHTILIVFPIYGKRRSKRLVDFYRDTHPDADVRFIQLGSTGIYDASPTLQGEKKAIWSDRHSPYNKSNTRAIAEDELLSLNKTTPTTVLELCGLWGGERSMRNWVIRVCPNREACKVKTSLHMIHGFDLARAILAVHNQFHLAAGSRWIVTDGRVYDWWDLASAWGHGGVGHPGKVPIGPHPKWVREFMEEENVRALPRCPELLGRCLDSREFWATFGLSPARARLEGE